MRTMLYTGKGGVGKTSVAAATALKAAKDGKESLGDEHGSSALAGGCVRYRDRAGPEGNGDGVVGPRDGPHHHDRG